MKHLQSHYSKKTVKVKQSLFPSGMIAKLESILSTAWRKKDKTQNSHTMRATINEPVHEISNNEVCTTRKASDQSAHTRSLIKVFASRLSII